MDGEYESMIGWCVESERGAHCESISPLWLAEAPAIGTNNAAIKMEHITKARIDFSFFQSVITLPLLWFRFCQSFGECVRAFILNAQRANVARYGVLRISEIIQGTNPF